MRQSYKLFTVLLLALLALVGCSGDGTDVVYITATPAATNTPNPTPTAEVADVCDIVPERHVCRIGDDGLGWPPINPGWEIDNRYERKTVPWIFAGDLVPTFTIVDEWNQSITVLHDEWAGWNSNTDNWSTAYVPEVQVDISQDVAQFNMTSAKGFIGWQYDTAYVPLQANTGYLIKFVYEFEADCKLNNEGCPFEQATEQVEEVCTFYTDNSDVYVFPPQTVDNAERSKDEEEAAWFLMTGAYAVGGAFVCGWNVQQGVLDGGFNLDQFLIQPVGWNSDDAQVTIQ